MLNNNNTESEQESEQIYRNDWISGVLVLVISYFFGIFFFYCCCSLQMKKEQRKKTAVWIETRKMTQRIEQSWRAEGHKTQYCAWMGSWHKCTSDSYASTAVARGRMAYRGKTPEAAFCSLLSVFYIWSNFWWDRKKKVLKAVRLPGHGEFTLNTKWNALR